MRILGTVLASVCTLLAFGAADAGAADRKLDVVASFSIIGDFARQVGGDQIRLRTLVGPNGDAHVYEPRPADAIALSKADVVLVNGLQFEGFLSRLVEASGTKAPIVELTQGAAILQDPAGGHFHYYGGKAVFHQAPSDPHAWHSVRNAEVYVRNVADAFCAADREHCAEYRTNAEAYLSQLSALDAEIRDRLATLPLERRTVVVGHNAFRYFGVAYGVTFLSPQGTSTGAEASAASVGTVVRALKERKAGAVFAENITDARLVEGIAAEAGMKLGGMLYSDALSDAAGPAPSYAALMRHNLKTISGEATGH